MATIQLSTAVKNLLATNIWNTAEQRQIVFALAAMPMLAYDSNSGVNAWAGIYIMKGTVPSTFVGMEYLASRSADILVGFTVQQAFNSSSFVNNVYTMNTSLRQASGTGTATWFWIVQGDRSFDALTQQVIGTVGTLGSGADLEIQTTSIVTGSPYRVSNLVFVMPDSWTV